MACRKAGSLVSCGAKVRVVSPEVTADLKRMARRGRIRWVRRPFRASDLRGIRLAVCATDDPTLNRRVSRLARRREIWINVVDQPALCSFIFPSVVRRGKLTVAISTGGMSPALARRLRLDIQKRYGRNYAALLKAIAPVRREVVKKVAGIGERKRLFEKALAAYFDVLRQGMRSHGKKS